MLTVGSLFSGIGGFDLGLSRAGMQTLWFCEQDPYCQRVLARHWPGVPCHPDVRALVADAYGAELRNGERPQRKGAGQGVPEPGDDGAARVPDVPVSVPYVDVLCGGFPCQDISVAGRGAGLAGERSGLWREFARLIGELRPRYVLVENVPAITSRGGVRVLEDLASLGFDAEWDCLSAAQFGAPHRRLRFWLVAYPNGPGLEGRGGEPRVPGATDGQARWGTGPLGDPDQERRNGRAGQLGPRRRGEPADPSRREPQSGVGLLADGLPTGLGGHWDREPDIPRVATGVPQRVDRLRALGNALVPQIAEWIGCQIIEWERVMA